MRDASRTFPARYTGRCNTCDDLIYEGDQVLFVDEQLVHADCTANTTPERPTDLCPRCYIALPVNGECCD